MSEVWVGVDQGTGATRAVAFDESGTVLADARIPVPVTHPQPGWVEKDAAAVVDSVAGVLADVTGQVGAGAVSGVGLDNEGETVVAWDAGSLQPLAPAIVWSCRRSEQIVERLRADGVEERVRELAGTPLDPYFSSSKITWLLENDADVQAAAAAGRARFGTLDAYLLARLGDGALTEPSTAARTQLQAIAAPGRWDPDAVRDLRCRPADAAADRRVDRRAGDDRELATAGDAGGSDRRPRRARLHRFGRCQGHLRHRRVPARKHRLPTAP